VIREPTGEFRLAWRLILIILLYAGIVVLLRVIPIGLLTAFMVKAGMTQGSAVESASTIIFEDSKWSTVIGVLSGLVGFLIVWFMVRVVEKSTFACKAIGLDWRRSSPSMIILGALLAFILFIAYMIIARLFETSDSSEYMLLMGVSIAVFFQKFILYIAMGFGEEVVFRAYVQTRLLARFGVIWGVLGTALVFTLLHQISYKLSPVTIFSGIILWTTLGALYYLSKSLYLVGTFHGVMNTMLNTLNFEVGDVAALIVHALALLTLIVFVRFKTRLIGNFSNPA
jgi:membrane protease YdiL (CAAX protease family)